MNPLETTWVSDPTIASEYNLTADHGGWKTVSRELKFDGEYAKVFMETVVTPTRPEGIDWTVVRRKTAVAIATRIEDGKWLLVNQERVAIRQSIWEFPAGQVDFWQADWRSVLERSVWRELREETGYESGPESILSPLGVFFPSVGFTDEHSYIFLADRVVPHAKGANPDETEKINDCRAFSTDELTGMIASGEIRDGNTLAAFAKLVAMKLL